MKKDQTSFDAIAEIYHFLRKDGAKEYQLLIQTGRFREKDKILEVGGGTGVVATHFVDKVKEVRVLDPSTKMLEKIKNPSIKKKVGRCQKIPFEDETFDIVYVVDALHHFTNSYPKEEWKQQMNICTKELLRVLKKNGQLLIVEFNPDTLMGRLIKFFENKIMCFGSSFYTPELLEALFSKENSVDVFYPRKFCYIVKIMKR